MPDGGRRMAADKNKREQAQPDGLNDEHPQENFRQKRRET
jgi:hypothetical protein